MSILADTFSTTWLELPSLPYRAAFDLCALEAARFTEPVAVIADSQFYARELLKRLQREVYLLPFAGWDPSQAASRAEIGPEIDWTQIQLAEPDGMPWPVHLVIWAGHRSSEIEPVVEQLKNNLNAGSQLLILTTSRLRSLLPEWGLGGHTPAHDAAGTVRMVRSLQRSSFRIRAVCGFQGPASLAWGFLGRLAAQAGRQDLLDRCLAGMRRTLCTDGPGAYLASVSVLVAERG